MDPHEIELPASLIRNALKLPTGRRWINQWQGLVAHYTELWDLHIELPEGRNPWTGHGAIVIPVRRADGQSAVLKLTVPHQEALPEPDALRLWNGRGAVRLLKSAREHYVLLLERLDGDRSLYSTPLESTAAPWGELVRELSLPAATGPLWDDIPAVAEQAEMWTDTMPADWERLGRPFERWLLEYALEVCQVHGAVGRRSARDVLLHSDLHYQNVIPRLDNPSGFLAIDPKPLVGDAEFAVAPMLWNRIQDLSVTDAEGHLRERCSDLAFAAGLDPLLARDWSVVREVRNALGYVENSHSDDAKRSLWVASTLLRRTLPELPAPAALARP